MTSAIELKQPDGQVAELLTALAAHPASFGKLPEALRRDSDRSLSRADLTAALEAA